MSKRIERMKECSPLLGRCSFTFLEVIVVIFILGIFLSFSVPSLSAFLNGHSKRDARLASDVLSFAADSALLMKQNIPLIIDLDTAHITLDMQKEARIFHFPTLAAAATQQRTVRQGKLEFVFSSRSINGYLFLTFKDRRAHYQVQFDPLSYRVFFREISQ